jgi:dTMP kinase
VVQVREPGGTPLGETIRGLLLDSVRLDPWAEVHLFAAQRCELAREVIGPAIARGEVVVSDRSYYSSIAYQGGARGLGMDLVRLLNETGLGDTRPEAVFFLDVEPDLALRRQHREDRIGGQGVEFQRAVREAYIRLAEADPKVIRLDGSAEVGALASRIVGAIA